MKLLKFLSDSDNCFSCHSWAAAIQESPQEDV